MGASPRRAFGGSSADKHPESTYWSVGKPGKDQVADDAGRLGENVEETEKWLGSVLAY